jgi:hypothetical protein
MFNDITGGTGLLGDVLFIIVYTLKSSFYKGKQKVSRTHARKELLKNCPEGRLHIDGETYYGTCKLSK